MVEYVAYLETGIIVNAKNKEEAFALALGELKARLNNKDDIWEFQIEEM